MDRDLLRPAGKSQRCGTGAGPDAGPLGGATRPASERDEKVTRPGVGIRRRQQAATRHDDQATLHATRRDECHAAGTRQGLALVANLQGIIVAGGEWSETGVVEGRMRERSGVKEPRAPGPARRPRPRSWSDRDAGALRPEPLVHDPAIERASSFGVCEHDDAVAANPLVQNREIADGERVGQVLGLASAEDQHGAVAGEILPGEMRIIAAVLYAVARRMPWGRGGCERQRIGKRQVNDEKATRLRLASSSEQQQQETQAPHRRGSTRRLYLRSAARSRSCGSADTRRPLIPVIDSAATIALTIASSVA